MSSNSGNKREADFDYSKAAIGTHSPKKARGAKPEGRLMWSPQEEMRFLEAIDRLVKAGLWAEVKGDEALVKRGANGMRSHWDAMFKKMKKDAP